jgi:hypothetical protein
MLAAIGLVGFPTRVTSFAGIPLNAVAAIGLMALGGLLVRHAGSSPLPAGATNGKQVLH